MYHIYCETEGAEIITPDWPDAERAFRRFIRKYPTEVVDLDKLHDYVSPDDYGRRERVMQCDPN